VAYEDRSALDLFFTDGDFGHFGEDRNWFTRSSPEERAAEAAESHWEPPRNPDGSLVTRKTEEAQPGVTGMLNRAGHSINDGIDAAGEFFSGLF